MKSRKLHSYKVLLRVAKVDELRAQAALAAAVEQEAEAQRDVAVVEETREAVLKAKGVCVSEEGQMDLARYELVTRLDAALCDRLHAANAKLEDASVQRARSASENVMAKRYRERVAERCDDVRTVLMRAHISKTQEDAIELWLKSSAEGV